MNQELKMQAAAFKDKKKGPPACKEGANDPAYENITLTFRNRDQSKSSHSPPKNKVPVRSRPSSDPAQFSHWLHRAMMSLHILLALSCVVLLALVLMKNSELSQELLVLKRRSGMSPFRCKSARKSRRQAGAPSRRGSTRTRSSLKRSRTRSRRGT